MLRFSKYYANKLAEERLEKRKSLENIVIMLEKHLVETELESETLNLEYESVKASLSMDFPVLVYSYTNTSLTFFQDREDVGQLFMWLKIFKPRRKLERHRASCFV